MTRSGQRGDGDLVAGVRITARSSAFSSSRTLPGHSYSCSASSVPGASCFSGSLRASAMRWRKCSASSGMSSRALAQRRQVQRDDVQAVVQIAAEVPRRISSSRSRLVAAMRRVSIGIGLRRADGNHFAMLQHAQQLHLRRRRRLADLVEEERALRRGGEETDLVLDRAGERALHVAEQLALEQALRAARRS